MAFMFFSSKEDNKKYSLIKESVPIIQLYMRYIGIQWPIFAGAIILTYIHIKLGPTYAITTFITVAFAIFLYARKNKDKVKAYITNIEERKKNAINITNKEYEKILNEKNQSTEDIINDNITKNIVISASPAPTTPEPSKKQNEAYISAQNLQTSIPYTNYNSTKINIKYKNFKEKKDKISDTKTIKDTHTP